MGLRNTILTWLEAGRRKNEPDRQTEAFPWWAIGNRHDNQPVMKRTPANMRALSESPIPRRAINVIKEGISRLPWSVTAINDDEQEKYDELCKLITRNLRKPNPTDSFRMLIDQIVEDMLVGGAGSSEILRAGDPKRPFRLYPVDIFTIEHYPDWDGKPDSIRYAQRLPDGKIIPLTDNELMYIRMNPRSNTPFGLSPLETVWESVNYFLHAHKNAGNQARNTFIRKVLNLGKTATKEAVSAFRTYWENEVQGRGKMPIIGGDDPSVLDLGATDDKALLIEWQRFLIEIVAVAFGVSPKKLGQTKDVNRSTADSEDEDTNATIRYYANIIAEAINDKIIDDMFGVGDVIHFQFHYAQSLEDQKTQAEIDEIYLKYRVITPDEVRRKSLSMGPLPNYHGEVILTPNNMTVLDVNESQDDDSVPPEGEPQEPDGTIDRDEDETSVKSRRMKAQDQETKGTEEEEREFIAAYIFIMLSILNRGGNESDYDSLLSSWTPTAMDVQKLKDELYKLSRDAWLNSYNRRRMDLGADILADLPVDVDFDMRRRADEMADKIMDTYKRELENRMKELADKYKDLTDPDMFKRFKREMEDWMTDRMKYKSVQIADYEAGKSWNEALFAHDAKYAPDTEYIVLPIATNHDECAAIIAGAPYTRETLPAELPLHPNCPHRYYAIVYGGRRIE